MAVDEETLRRVLKEELAEIGVALSRDVTSDMLGLLRTLLQETPLSETAGPPLEGGPQISVTPAGPGSTLNLGEAGWQPWIANSKTPGEASSWGRSGAFSDASVLPVAPPVHRDRTPIVQDVESDSSGDEGGSHTFALRHLRGFGMTLTQTLLEDKGSVAGRSSPRSVVSQQPTPSSRQAPTPLQRLTPTQRARRPPPLPTAPQQSSSEAPSAQMFTASDLKAADSDEAAQLPGSTATEPLQHDEVCVSNGDSLPPRLQPPRLEAIISADDGLRDIAMGEVTPRQPQQTPEFSPQRDTPATVTPAQSLHRSARPAALSLDSTPPATASPDVRDPQRHPERHNQSMISQRMSNVLSSNSDHLTDVDTIEVGQTGPLLASDRTTCGPLLGPETCLARIVSSKHFDSFIGFFVLLNIVAIGAQVDYMARHHVDAVPELYILFNRVFCFLFVVELLLRLLVYGGSLFVDTRGRLQTGNVFDCVLVILQVAEEVLAYVGAMSNTLRLNFTFMRVLRFFGVVRVFRSVRILRLISELRVLVVSIGMCLRSLAWTVVLLLLVIYVFGIWLTQITVYYQILDSAELLELETYYGDVGSSILSLFQAITGGIDWRQAVDPLMRHVSPLLAPVFVFYIVFAVFAVFNIVTGIFVSLGLQSAKEDTDFFMVSNLKQLFKSNKISLTGSLSWKEFESLLRNKSTYLVNYFRAIDVDPCEAKGVFQLLDLDGSGTIDAEEFLNGCLRLRGPAKALDLAVLMHEVKEIRKDMRRQQRRLDRIVRYQLQGQPILGSTVSGLFPAEAQPASQRGHSGGSSSVDQQLVRLVRSGPVGSWCP